MHQVVELCIMSIHKVKKNSNNSFTNLFGLHIHMLLSYIVKCFLLLETPCNINCILTPDDQLKQECMHRQTYTKYSCNSVVQFLFCEIFKCCVGCI